MKKLTVVLSALALAAMLSPSSLRASSRTYHVDESVGTGYVIGSITTDGVLGTLGSGDILNWDLTLNDGLGENSSFTLLGPLSGNNSQDLLLGSDLSAAGGDLYFNYSGGDGGIFLLENAVIGDSGPFLCYSTVTNCSPPNIVGIALSAVNGEDPSVGTPLEGRGVIATSTPEPGDAALLLTGLPLIGVLRRRLARLANR